MQTESACWAFPWVHFSPLRWPRRIPELPLSLSFLAVCRSNSQNKKQGQGEMSSIDKVTAAESSFTPQLVGTWEWDPADNTSRLSPELFRLFGTSAFDPDHAQVWASRVFPADWANVQQKMQEGAETGNMEFEYRYQHPEAGLRWLYCRGARLHDESRIFGLVMDITSSKLASETSRQ